MNSTKEPLSESEMRLHAINLAVASNRERFTLTKEDMDTFAANNVRDAAVYLNWISAGVVPVESERAGVSS